MNVAVLFHNLIYTYENHHEDALDTEQFYYSFSNRIGTYTGGCKLCMRSLLKNA